jgi:hypothetical protein
MPRRFATLRAAAALALLALPAGIALPAAAGAPEPHSAQRATLSPEEIIQRFTQAESMLRDARNQYAFKQDVLIQTIGGGEAVTGSYRRVSEIIFDDRSQRIERITYFPQPTLRELQVTQEDLMDLGIIQPFALTADELPKYTVRMVGRERIDEIDAYVFDVLPRDPKAFERSKQRFFAGRVWVEDQDYMIVKVNGKAGPEVGSQRFPRFETYREHVDGKFWFPTYTYADDVLSFPSGQDVRVRMVVKYTDYREFTGTITLGDPTDEP